MLRQVVVKLNRACNLRCAYCYYINDRTVGLGTRMRWEVLEVFLNKYSAYCGSNGITGTVVFHGGEPMLAGKAFLRRALAHPGFERGELRASIQTNGTILDEEWIDLLRAGNVHVGVSLDGLPQIHDKNRITVKGDGTYDAIVGNIRSLQHAGIDVRVLCVVEPSANGRDVYRNLVDIGIRRFDFLPQVSNHAIQQTRPVDLAGTSEFLFSAFLAWLEDSDPRVSVRLFQEMFHRKLRRSSGYSAIGMDSWNTFAVLEVDGEFARAEELAETNSPTAERYRMSVNVLYGSIEDAVAELSVHDAQIDHWSLPSACVDCDVSDVCNGGNIATRYDLSGSFDNPGIHCGSFYRLGKAIKSVIDFRLDDCGAP